MFKNIHHLAIICSNYALSKDFYSRILGLSIIREVYRQECDSYKLDLALNNEQQLELFSFPNPPARQSYPEACGLRHLAFKVTDIQQVISYLENNGIVCEPIRIDEYTKKRFSFFADPDGLALEIYEFI